MQELPRTEYALVRGLTRGLDVLRALNHAPCGRAQVADLAAATGIHRTTVRRLLETLLSEGYVQCSASDERTYSLTLKSRDLSDGFTDREWVSSVATPVMGELLGRIRWPSDLSTLDGQAMLIRESTHRFSPLSFERGMVGTRMPLLLTASGKAYLAACDDEERRQLMLMAAASEGPEAALAAHPRLVARMVEQVRRQGYATNEGEWHKGSRTSAIALPIRHQGRVVGCLNVIYARKAASLEQAVARYLPPLREAVDEIERRLLAMELQAA